MTPQSGSLEALLRPIIWRRRIAFYDAAVAYGIIDDFQKGELLELHRLRDDEQDERERRDCENDQRQDDPQSR